MKREKWICTGLAVIMALVLPACAQKIEREPVTVQSAGMGLELASKDDGKSVKAANAETKTDKKETPRKTQTAKQADSGVGTVSKEGQYSLTYAKDSFTQQQDENGTVALVSKDQKARIEIGRGFYEGVIETVKDADKEEASVRGGQAQQKKSGTEENTDPSENAEFKISVQGGQDVYYSFIPEAETKDGEAYAYSVDSADGEYCYISLAQYQAAVLGAEDYGALLMENSGEKGKEKVYYLSTSEGNLIVRTVCDKDAQKQWMPQIEETLKSLKVEDNLWKKADVEKIVKDLDIEVTAAGETQVEISKDGRSSSE